MDYRIFGDTVYVRLDRGDEIIGSILDICRKEQISSATFNGIGGCSEAQIQTFLPETGTFETENISGMLELVSLMGNVISDDQEGPYLHAHGLFSYKDGDKHCISAGHIKSITVLYTAEIELRPVKGGTIKKKFNEETGTGFWSFE